MGTHKIIISNTIEFRMPVSNQNDTLLKAMQLSNEYINCPVRAYHVNTETLEQKLFCTLENGRVKG